MQSGQFHGNQVTVDILINSTSSPVGSAGVLFDPIASGTTTVSATAIGFTPYAGSFVTVTITP